MKKQLLRQIGRLAALALAVTLTTSARAQLEVAEQLLVDLNAARGVQTNAAGQILGWTNYGTVSGWFAVDGANTTYPALGTTSGELTAIFDGGDRLKASFLAPDLITAGKPGMASDDFTIEYWVLNPAIAGEEWILNISQRGTTLRHAGFGYGNNSSFGAVAHWAAPDMGFDGGVPAAGVWHHIAITYNGTNEVIYVDGVLNAQETKVLNVWENNPLSVGAGYTLTAVSPYTNNLNYALPYSGSLKALRIHSGALSAAQVAANYASGLSAVGAVPAQIEMLPISGNVTFNGRLAGVAEPTELYVYYGATDAFTNKAAWGASVTASGLNNGAFAINAGVLNQATAYYYRYYSSNSLGEVWSPVGSFVSLGIASLPPKTVLPTYARLAAQLNGTNYPATTSQVYLYWGLSDGDTTPENWGNVVDCGTRGVGQVVTKIPNLTPGTTYFYRYAMSNVAGVVWPSATSSFTTPALFSTIGFAYNLQITFSGYNKAEMLTNFPALVVLNTNIPNFSYAQFLSGFADLRFADASGGELNYEIETWNPEGDSLIWVQVPELEQNTAIQAFWGKAGMAQPAYTTNGATWSDNFAAVWHMTNSLVTDSTANGYNATAIRNAAAVTATPGMVGGGLDYNAATGSGATSVGDLDLQEQTLSAWVWLRDSSRDGAFMAKDGVMFWWQQGTAMRFETFNWGGDTTIQRPVVGDWIYFSVTADKAGYVQALYTNGVLAAGPWNKSTIPSVNNNQFTLGGGYAGGDGRAHNGKLDECRAERVARSANWIWACYKNQKTPSDFMTLSAASWLGAPLSVANPTVKNIGTTTVTLGARVASDAGNGFTSWGTVFGTTPAPRENGLATVGSQSVPYVFTQDRTGFSPGTLYYYAGWASNAIEGVVYSADGQFVTEPEAATGVAFTSVGNNAMTINWTPGAGAAGSLVLVREAQAVTALPFDGTSYPANALYGSGTDLGGGSYAAYAGAGSSVTVTGLLPGATYHVAIFTYAGEGALLNYRQAGAAAASQAAATDPGFGVAGQVLIDVNILRGVETNEFGGITNWINYGTMGGSFRGDSATFPTLATVNGLPCVFFDGAQNLRSTFTAPLEITGKDVNNVADDWTMEMWVLNPSIAAEEWVFSWAQRGADGRCGAIGYGTHGTWGALGLWGAPDMGFDGGVPLVGQWHHIVATYDGLVNNIYVDGALNATENKTLNAWDGGPCLIGDQFVNNAGVYSAFNSNVKYSGYLTGLRVHSRALTAPQVAANFNAGPLNPQGPATVQVQPQGRTVSEFSTVSFTAMVGGEPPIGVQWLRNGEVIPGANAQTLVLTNVTAADHGAVFSMVASNVAAGATNLMASSNAVLQVITAQDALAHRYSFNDGMLDSVAGAHGTLINGATVANGQLVLNGNRQYAALPGGLLNGWNSVSVEFWGSFGTNAGWARAFDFGDYNANLGRRYVFFTPHSGNNDFRMSFADADPGYNHEFVVSGPAANNLDNIGMVHVMCVWDPPTGSMRLYTNGVLAGSRSDVGFPMSGISNVVSWIGRAVYFGDPYLNGALDEFRIYNIALSDAQVLASYTNGPNAAIAAGPVSLAGQPQNLTVGECGGATFAVTALGSEPIAYQWYRDDLVIDGATNRAYALPFVDMTDDAAAFHCVVSNSLNTVTSAVATLTVLNSTASLVHRYDYGDNANDWVGIADGTLMGGAALTNGAVALNGVDAYVELPGGVLEGMERTTIEFWATFGANPNWVRVFDFGDINTNNQGRFYLFYTPRASFGGQHLTIANSDPGGPYADILNEPPLLDSVGPVHVACVIDPPNHTMSIYTNGVLAATSASVTRDLSSVANVYSYIGKSLFAADPYLNASIDEFRIYDSALSAGKIMQNYQLGPNTLPTDVPLLIVSHPQSVTNVEGAVATLSLGAASCTPMSYQWYFEGAPLAGATNKSLVFPAVQHTNAGTYQVVVSSQGGTLTSTVARLTINRNPVAGDDTLGTYEGQALQVGAAKLLANDVDPDGDTLAVESVSATSTNGGTVALAGGVVTFTPVAGFVGQDLFTVVITDGWGGLATNNVQVAVLSSNAPALTIVSGPFFTNGLFRVTFTGIPNYTYAIERADNVNGPYQSFTNLTASPTGEFELRDQAGDPVPPQRYYRSRFP